MCDPLLPWVKNTLAVRCSIDARASYPLPVSIVDTRIIVNEMRGKVGLAPSPVDAQQTSQEVGGDESSAVMHIARFVQLSHGRIYNGKSRPSFTPSFKVMYRISPRQSFLEVFAII
jgi:hypothetical protein